MWRILNSCITAAEAGQIKRAKSPRRRRRSTSASRRRRSRREQRDPQRLIQRTETGVDTDDEFKNDSDSVFWQKFVSGQLRKTLARSVERRLKNGNSADGSGHGIPDGRANGSGCGDGRAHGIGYGSWQGRADGSRIDDESPHGNRIADGSGYDGNRIANGKADINKIATGNEHRNRIADGSGYGEQIADGSPHGERIADGSPHGNRIADGSPHGERIADGSPHGERIADGSPHGNWIATGNTSRKPAKNVNTNANSNNMSVVMAVDKDNEIVEPTSLQIARRRRKVFVALLALDKDHNAASGGRSNGRGQQTLEKSTYSLQRAEDPAAAEAALEGEECSADARTILAEPLDAEHSAGCLHHRDCGFCCRPCSCHRALWSRPAKRCNAWVPTKRAHLL
ncbi:hypothetical protein BOX15_Mlig012234g1 [Macrostomum lignano]|uniref:Uncharacterized protein n=1 Tax=Macrostomum lignano TaxID=282301 RepID=A0A267EGL3_9PLAT|nr:hypothetical protein BOX15_Mlig012234g1 [Macrostomum lignano]